MGTIKSVSCGAITSAVNFIANAVIAVANFIAHAAEVIAQTAMQVFNTVASVVKTAVEVMKKVVDAAVEWVKSEIEKAYKEFLNANKEILNSVVTPMMEAWNKYKENGEINKERMKEFWEAIMKVVYVSMVVWGTIEGLLYIVMGMTIGLGNIVLAAISIAIQEVLSMNIVGGEKPGWLSKDMGKNELINKIASEIGERYEDSGLSEGETTSFFLSWFSIIISGAGWLIASEELDVAGALIGMISAAVGTVVIILWFTGETLEEEAREHMRWIVYGISIIGIFIGLIGLAKAMSAGNGVGVAISSIGIIMGIAASLYSIYG